MSPLDELPDASTRNLHHFVVISQNSPHHGILYIHLPGSGGAPEDYQYLARYAAYLTKNHELEGILMFAGPGDHLKDYGSAPWLSYESKTSVNQMYGFIHRLDPVSRLFF